MNNSRMSLLDNSRFYILTFSLLLSVVVVAWIRVQIPSDQLFYIRTQQTFGLLCIIFWYVALIISPVGHIIGKQNTRHLEFARRAIGVSAFYFALLHSVVALWGQLGGIDQLHHLPELFKWSLAGGGVALAILGIMAITSFDKIVKKMTFRWWKWLHRLVYIGGILVVLHIWTVGTHLSYTNVQIAAFIALFILAGLELFRVIKQTNKQYFKLEKPEIITLFFVSWMIVGVLLFMIPMVVQNYHSRHEATHSQDDS